VAGCRTVEAGAVNKAFFRGLCLLVLLLSLGVRLRADWSRETAMAEFDASAAVAQILRNYGLQVRENPVKPPRVLSVVVYFQRPECDRTSLVLPYFINAEVEPLLARAAEPGFDRHFYYMDSSWREQHRVSMFLAWARYAVLDLLGASPYVPVKKAIVLADPPDCHPADAIDWRPLWAKKPRPGTVKAGNEASRG
jgi:hypothetical protein